MKFELTFLEVGILQANIYIFPYANIFIDKYLHMELFYM
jgi:hypothetical protein